MSHIENFLLVAFNYAVFGWMLAAYVAKPRWYLLASGIFILFTATMRMAIEVAGIIHR